MPTRLTAGGLAALTISGLVYAAEPARAAEFEILAGTQAPAGTPYDDGLKRFAELVEERSAGRVEVEIFPGAQLGNEMELFQALQQGTVDIAVVSPGNIAEFVPQIAILEMPFMITNAGQRDRVVEGEPLARLSRIVEDRTGAVIIGVFGGGTRNMFFKEPAGDMGDFADRRFRVQASRQLTDSYSALGLEPTVTSYGELYNALQQGVVEGAEMEAIYVESAGFPEVAPNFLMTRHVITIRPVLMSGETLDNLPSDLRTIVVEAALESARFERGLEADADTSALERMGRIGGVTFTEVDVAPMIERVRPVWRRYAEEWELVDLMEQIDSMR